MSRPSIILSPQVPVLRPSALSRQTPAIRIVGEDLPDLPVIDIAGTPVHLVDERQARRVIVGAMRDDVRPPLAVASVNLDHIHHFPTGAIGESASDIRWLNLVDGAPIARQVRRLTDVDHPRLAGSDIITGILTDVAAAGLSLAVIGGSSDVTDALRRRLANDWPGLRFAGHWTPPRDVLTSREDSLALCEQIRAARADVILVCLGKPRQERWIADFGAETGANVLLAFGAVVDFLAGRVSRAPQWVARAGVEWMWRLMLEPRRLARRYLIEGPPAYMAVRRSHTSPRGHEPST